MSRVEIVTETQYERHLRFEEEAFEAAKDSDRERRELDRADFEFRKEAHKTWRSMVEREVTAWERMAEALERLAPKP